MIYDKNKQTPGPWRAVFYERHDMWDVSANRYGDGEHFSVLEDPSASDARLIAAAPDMLEALCAAADEYRAGLEGLEAQPDPLMRQVFAAIAKAKGAT